jgi:hypothetical protein
MSYHEIITGVEVVVDAEPDKYHTHLFRRITELLSEKK